MKYGAVIVVVGSEEVVQAAVSKDGYALQYATEELRDDQDVSDETSSNVSVDDPLS